MDRQTYHCIEEAKARLADSDDAQTGLVVITAFESWLLNSWDPHKERAERVQEELREHLKEDVPAIHANLTAVNQALWATDNYPQQDGHKRPPALVDLARQLCVISRIGAVGWMALAAMQGYVLFLLEKLWGTMP